MTFSEVLNQHWLNLLVLSAALLIALALSPVVDARSIESMDFTDKPWLHHNPGGIDFGSTRLMIGQAAFDGGELVADLFWRTNNAQPITATLALELPGAHLFGGPSAIVQQTIHIEPGAQRYRIWLPHSLPTGFYYLRVQVGARAEYLPPLWTKHVDLEPSLPRWGKITRTLAVAVVQTRQIDRKQLEVKLSWANYKPIEANYAVSLRLRDAAGKVWTSLDTQPGYGFLPTSLWGIDTINDVYALDLPDNLPREGVYGLDVIVYRVASLQEVGRMAIEGVRLGGAADWQIVPQPLQNFTLPASSRDLDVMFGDSIKLTGYALEHAAQRLTLTLAWQATRDINTNYKVFVHVFDPATEKIVAQSDAGPRHNTYPTSIWSNGETIVDPIEISLANTPPGSYRVAIGLYDEGGRLPVSGSNADEVNGRVVLTDEVTLP